MTMQIKFTRQKYTFAGCTAEGRKLSNGDRSVFIPDAEPISRKLIETLAAQLRVTPADIKSALDQ